LKNTAFDAILTLLGGEKRVLFSRPQILWPRKGHQRTNPAAPHITSQNSISELSEFITDDGGEK